MQDDLGSFFISSENSLDIRDSPVIAKSTFKRKNSPLKVNFKVNEVKESSVPAQKSKSEVKNVLKTKKILPNHTIKTTFKKSSRSPKYKKDMYDPSSNLGTLQNFFNVKLVMTKKPVSFCI